MTAPFDPHEHPHRHPDERQLPSLEDRAVADPEHARSHASVWLTDVTAGYDHRAALEDVDLAVEPGSLLAIVGPNGAGKSTLLKLMAGLLQPWEGRIEVLGEPPGQQARRIAYVPQAELVDWAFPVTVGDVVMMGRYPALGPLRRPGPDDRAAVSKALEQVGMAEHRIVQIGQLSGGQRRRVFLARALAADPDLYLLDEPVTGVDATTQEELMDLLEAEARRGKTVIATTHDLACAAQRFQKVATVNRRIVAHGPASLVLDPDVLAATYGGHCWSSAARRSCSTTPTTTTRRPAPSGISTRTRADDRRAPRPARLRLLRPRAPGGGRRRHRVRGGRHVRGAARDRVHRRRGRHAAFPGVVAAYLLASPFYLGAAVAAVATALAIGYVTRRARIRGDTAIGVLFAGTFALGVFLFSTIDGYVGDLFGFLFG